MKATSGHFIFQGDTDYRDLTKVFPEVLRTFLKETGQMPEDEEVMEMFIHLNQVELERNEKPEGYNRKGRMRLVFPLDSKQFYIRSLSKSGEVVRLAERISKILSSSGVDHELEFNLLYNAR